MLILYWICAALAVGLGYVVGANIKRAFYESRIEELEGQCSALVSVNENLRFELANLQEELAELVTEVRVGAPEAVRFCGEVESNVVRLELSATEQARLVARMRTFVEDGQVQAPVVEG
jgi:hypothetical protein